MDKASISSHVDRLWEESVVSELIEYIRIPNKSVAFDREWQAHGHMDRAVARFEAWARRQPLKGMTLEVVRLAGRTPLLFMEIPGDSKDCVLLYGHMDKQPEMTGWREGLGPWDPVLEGDRLYGRGSADDGYAMFACLGAIGALQANSIPHARCVVVIEACEESGSFDLPHYREHLAKRIDARVCVSRWIRDAATTSSCGRRHRCAAWSVENSASRFSPKASIQVTPAESCRIVSESCDS
jgi:acetylornithine deacetylase/succinyl-diaminopimelate desuccinylase-like protein